MNDFVLIFHLSLFSELLFFFFNPTAAKKKQDKIESVKSPLFCFYSWKIFSFYNYFTAASLLIKT